ncbi:Hydrolase (HAD superfamily) in cluster with DUF1447 [Alkalibacterium sp. AK22]|uniref:Cof-type HAD-IIB family hydrolase n=1 Tax=Alkalibacterium sp. AK22 TaxID=1229520 RepID=UPI00044FD55C|nr:Cof-type HAD-IIB family hydrolase [Alkalibacterium sp. AK22]EXJ22640.1 Hydrolase (HAD superfamily) in cluster with DUF1447 [Alkalibacterium sp. AK22]
MKPTALVFFDLDGTLLNADSMIDEDVKKALSELKQKGAVPFIATGRSQIEIQHILEETVIDSYITLNGQYIHYEGEEVFRNVISPSIVKKMKNLTAEKNLALSLYSPDKIRATFHNDTIRKAYGFIHEEPPAVDAELDEKEDILMMLVLNEEPANDHQITQSFDDLSFFRNTPFSIDTISKGHNKAKGIDALLDAAGMTDVPLYAFGDGANDKEMLSRADHSVAMANGLNEVKELADYVTSANTDGGIREGLKHFGLID